MKKTMILIGCIGASVSTISSRFHEVCDPENLHEIISNVPIAIVYFDRQQTDESIKGIGVQQQERHQTLKKLASSKRYANAHIPFIHVKAIDPDNKRFIRAYGLKKPVSIIQIFQHGRPTKDFRLAGYNNEEAIKKFIEKKVGKEIDNLSNEQVNNETCPQWIHDWYFYWPYQYYGYAHPYYWHDGFHISFGC